MPTLETGSTCSSFGTLSPPGVPHLFVGELFASSVAKHFSTLCFLILLGLATFGTKVRCSLAQRRRIQNLVLNHSGTLCGILCGKSRIPQFGATLCRPYADLRRALCGPYASSPWPPRSEWANMGSKWTGADQDLMRNLMRNPGRIKFHSKIHIVCAQGFPKVFFERPLVNIMRTFIPRTSTLGNLMRTLCRCC